MTSKKQTRVLITGSNGFVGKWLTDHLNSLGYEVHGTDLHEQSAYPLVTYNRLDILDAEKTAAVVADLQPAMICHLAGVSYLPDADDSPRKSIAINIAGTVALLDAVRAGSPAARVLLVGSAKEYSDSIMSDGVTEETPPQPSNFYGISKYAGELIGLQYARQFGIEVVCTRSFNHTGPGQTSRFVCSDWARQVAAISLGRAEPIVTVGDIDAIIDFSDVRDVVQAYRLLLEQGRRGEVYNVCSGNGIDLSWILGYLCGKAPQQIDVRYADEKRRNHKSNIKMIGSSRKLTGHTGWLPVIPLQQTLDELYAWWVNSLKTNGGRV